MRRSLFVVAVTVAVASLGACSGSTPAADPGTTSATAPVPAAGGTATAEPVAWAGTLCGGLSGAFAALTDAAKVDTMTDPVAKKAALTKYLDDFTKSLGDASTQLTAAGAPKVADGVTIHTTTLAALQGAIGKLTAIKSGLGPIDPKDPAFEDKIKALGQGPASPSEDVKAILKPFENPELKSAVAGSPACQKIKPQLAAFTG
jgi:hypothetical protein